MFSKLQNMNSKTQVDLSNNSSINNNPQNFLNPNVIAIDRIRMPNQQADAFQYLACNPYFTPSPSTPALSPPTILATQIYSPYHSSALAMFQSPQSSSQAASQQFNPFPAAALAAYQATNFPITFENLLGQQRPQISSQNHCTGNLFQQRTSTPGKLDSTAVDVHKTNNVTANNSSTNNNNQVIQVGLQCINQNNPININLLNDISGQWKSDIEVSGKINTSNTSSSSIALQDSDCGILNNSDHSHTSSGSSPNSSFMKINIDKGFTKDYDKKLEQLDELDSSKDEKFSNLIRLAMRGGDIAEKIAYIHRHRPCFKKIDSLCARMKQDLLRPNGVLPNINSQGIAWAVKDFIFVFTRIINSWIIIKGYVYNTPEGLNKIKSTLSPDFEKSFYAWQDTTMNFIENLVKSFIALDQLIQSQKAMYQKTNTDDTSSSSPNTTTSSSSEYSKHDLLNNLDISKSNFNIFDDSLLDVLMNNLSGNRSNDQNENNDSKIDLLNMLNYPTLIERANEKPSKEDYYKTGVYKTPSKDVKSSNPTTMINSTPIDILLDPNTACPVVDERATDLPWPSTLLSQYSNSIPSPPPPSPSLSTSFTGTSDGTSSNRDYCVQQQQGKQINCETSGNEDQEINYKLRILQNNSGKLLPCYDLTSASLALSYPKLTEKLEFLLERISNLSEGKYFFARHFTKNYFPDFMLKFPNFMDLRSIILKAQAGGYEHVFEIAHDLKLVIYYARLYLKNFNDDFLKRTIDQYEKEVDGVLKEEAFRNYSFEHINGDPIENLYDY